MCLACTTACNQFRSIVRNKSVSYLCDTIYVSYREGLYETSAPTKCSDIKKYSNEHTITEVITIEKKDFDIIYSFLSERQNKGSFSFPCEARLFVRTTTCEMCIGDLGCACDMDDNSIPVSDYALFLIKSLSGYYNFLDSVDLQYDRLINEFGIPANYKRNKALPLDDEDFFDYDDFRKVALVTLPM